MYYAASPDRRPRLVGLLLVGGLHLGLIIAAVNFVRTSGDAKLPDVLTTEIIQDIPPPPEEPPPPPPPDIDIDLAPMKDTVILPEIVFDTPPQPNAISEIAMANEVPDVRPPPGPAVDTKPAAQPATITQPGLPKRLAKPDYPRRSRQLNEEGITTLRVCVDAKGRVAEAAVVESSGFDRLDEASLVWVRALKGFTPKKVNGSAVDGGCMVLPLEWDITNE